MEIYVATKSEARKEILRNIGLKFREVHSEFEEKLYRDPVETVRYNALGKNISASRDIDGIVITFDTVVYVDGEVLGKPRNYEEAYQMLSKLSGRIHKVFTGVVVGREDRRLFGYGETNVKYVELNDEIIKWYLEREEYWRYAGGYRIQGLASLFIEYVEGDFFNVIGVPIQILLKLLRDIGVEPFQYLK